jgi:hypothetical protein
VTFPQLADLHHEDIPCPTCRKLFIKPEHLEKHEIIAHKELASNNQLARAIADAQGGSNDGLVTAVASLMESQSLLMERMAKSEDRFLMLMERLAPPAATPGRKAS